MKGELKAGLKQAKAPTLVGGNLMKGELKDGTPVQVSGSPGSMLNLMKGELKAVKTPRITSLSIKIGIS